MKKFVVVITSALIILCIAFAFYYAKAIDPKLVTTSIELEVASNNEFFAYEDGFVMLTGNKVSYYDGAMEQKWSLALSQIKPSLYIKDKFIVIGDKAGQGVILLESGKKVASLAIPEKLITAAVNKNGYFALVTEAQGYRGKVTVYNPKGEPVYKLFSGERHIVGLDIKANNKEMAVSALDLSGGGIKTILNFYNLGITEPLATYEYDNNTIAIIRYDKAGNLNAVGDKAYFTYNSRHKNNHTIDYQGRKLQKMAFNENGGAVLALSTIYGDSVQDGSFVQIFDKRGHVKGVYLTENPIAFLSGSGDYTVINKGNEFLLLNRKLMQIGSTKVDSEVDCMLLFPNHNRILAVSATSADVLKFGR